MEFGRYRRYDSPCLNDHDPTFPHLAGYELRSRLGEGGCGAVYLAVQTRLGRQVALKIIPQRHSGNDGNVRARFLRECSILSNIRHPNVLRVLDFGETDEFFFLSSEYLAGGTLRSRLGAAQPGIGVPECLRLASDMLTALQILHDADVVHRDIKPENILYRPSGEAVLGDLGVAKLSSPDQTRLTGTRDIVGTLIYLPPEAFQNSNIGPSADLFSLGITLYEALVGHHPNGRRPIGPSFIPPDPASGCPQCPPDLRTVILNLMQPDPIRRPRSATRVLTDLHQIRTFSTRSRKAPLFALMLLTLAAALVLFRPAGRSFKVNGVPPWRAATVTTRPRVRLLGVSGTGPDRQLWLQSTPRALARWTGAATTFEVGSKACAVPYPEAAGPTAAPTASLTFRFPSGSEVSLIPAAVTTGVSPPPGLPSLGISSAELCSSLEVQTRTGPLRVGDWIAEQEVSLVAGGFDGSALSCLDPNYYEAIYRKKQVRGIVPVLLSEIPELSSWMKGLGRFSRNRNPLPVMQASLEQLNMAYIANKGESHLRTLHQRFLTWEAALKAKHPGFSLLPWPVYFEGRRRRMTREIRLSSIHGKVESLIVSCLADDLEYWGNAFQALGSIATEQHAKVQIRHVWVEHAQLTANPLSLGPNRGEELQRGGLSAEIPMRAYILTRRFFPDAVTVFDLRSLLASGAPAPGPTWDLLTRTATLLRGFRYTRELGAPRLRTLGSKITGLVFANDSDHLVVIWCDGKAGRAVLTPARRGVLWTALPDAPAVLRGTFAMESEAQTLELTRTPALYEELRPLDARCSPPNSIEIWGGS